jgi:hypothetical protein
MRIMLVSATIGAAVLALQQGCDSPPPAEGYGYGQQPMVQPMDITLVPSNRSIAVGDTVTIVAQTRNMAGRNTDIQWSATGGHIEAGDNTLVARLRFDQPGTYQVTARAMVNDAVVDTDTVTITARPIEPAIPQAVTPTDDATGDTTGD